MGMKVEQITRKDIRSIDGVGDVDFWERFIAVASDCERKYILSDERNICRIFHEDNQKMIDENKKRNQPSQRKYEKELNDNRLIMYTIFGNLIPKNDECDKINNSRKAYELLNDEWFENNCQAAYRAIKNHFNNPNF